MSMLGSPEWERALALVDVAQPHYAEAIARLRGMPADVLTGVVLAEAEASVRAAGGNLDAIAEIVDAGYAGDLAGVLWFGLMFGYAVALADRAWEAAIELSRFRAFWEGLES